MMDSADSNRIVPEDAQREHDLGHCKFTFVDHQGTILLGRFDDAGAFHEGFAPIKVRDKSGCGRSIDRTGAIVISPGVCVDLFVFGEGLQRSRTARSLATSTSQALGNRARTSFWPVSSTITVVVVCGSRACSTTSRVEAGRSQGTLSAPLVSSRVSRTLKLRSGDGAFIDGDGRRMFTY